MKLITQANFGELLCDFYKQKNEYYVTRRQVGEALEHSDPNRSIANIHNRHKDRLDKYSTVINLITVEGGREVEREVIYYSLKGVMEICRWSRQPKADAFIDFCWEVMDALLTGTATLTQAQGKSFLEQSGVIKPPPPVVSGEQLARDFVDAIMKALQSGEYYLSPKGARNKSAKYIEEHAGATALGVYDDEIITLIASRAVEIYTGAPPSRYDITCMRRKLCDAGLVLPWATSADRKRRVEGKFYCVLRVRLDVIDALVGGAKLMALTGGKGCI